MTGVNAAMTLHAGTLVYYQHPSSQWAGLYFPSGVGGGSVFMDAGLELELAANAASRDDGVNFRNFDPYAFHGSKSAVCV